MAWTTPRTYTTSEVLTKAILDVHIRDNLQYLKDVLDGVQSQAVTLLGSQTIEGGELTLKGNNEIATLLVQSASAAAAGNELLFYRSRGTDPDSPTISQASDILGNVRFRGYDGAAFQNAALIRAVIDGTPAAGDMPGSLQFWTVPDTGSVTLAMRLAINAAGQTLIDDGTVSLPGLGWISDPDSGLYRVGANDLALALGGFQSYRFQTGGLTMQRSATAGGEQASYQVYCAGDNSNNIPTVVLARARTSIAAPSIVSAADVLGSIGFYGYDGSAYRAAATIQVGVYTTPGSNDMPGQLDMLVTPDGSATPTTVLSLRSNAIGFYGGTPATKPTVTGSRGGNAALQSLLTGLAGLGLITDSSS